jgi:hypothetical protein
MRSTWLAKMENKELHGISQQVSAGEEDINKAHHVNIKETNVASVALGMSNTGSSLSLLTIISCGRRSPET